MFTETFAPVNLSVDGQEMGPMLIFKDVTPIYVKVNFLKWCQIGLTEIGASRQLEAKVIKYMQTEFIGLINAIHCIALTMEDEDKMEENIDAYNERYYKKGAKKKDILNPMDFCVAFFDGITPESARSICWLLMEVVTANKDKYEYLVEPKTVLTLYERFAAIIGVGYDWHKAIREYHESKKKSGSKHGKKKGR